MITKHQLRWPVMLLALLALMTAPALAQSPNTATMIVAVVDQNGAVVAGAKVALTNTDTGAGRDTVSDGNGNATFVGLPLTGAYTVSISKDGFGNEERKDITLRAEETATLKVTLQVGAQKSEVTVIGTAEGVRADPQIGRRLDSPQIDQTPVLGRKATSLPLLNSAFRQAKGTGDLFVNATYFVTGVGGRRSTTFTLDGANNDESSARQTGLVTLPLGAIQEVTVLSSAFSSEYGWTSGPALNVVTKSGTNGFHGEGLFVARPGNGWQAETFSTKNFCPKSVPTCVTPTTLTDISPADIPDKLYQYAGSIGGPIVKDKTFYFLTVENTRQDRTVFLSPSLPAFVLPANGRLDYVGNYRQLLVNGRIDHKLTDNQNLFFRANVDRFFDNNPQDAVGGTNAPSVARKFSRRSSTFQLNHTATINNHLFNELRAAYLRSEPVNHWEAVTLSTAYTRAGSVPFTLGQSRISNVNGHQLQLSDTLTWSRGRNYFRFGGSLVRHTSGGQGQEPGTAVLGTFTFIGTNSGTYTRANLPFDQLTISDVQNYTQPVNYGNSTYRVEQWLFSAYAQDRIILNRQFTVDVGLRYDRQTLTDAKKNFEPRIGYVWHPGGDSRTAVRGGYGLYYMQIRANNIGSTILAGLDGLTTYTATPGQTGFPTSLTAVPLNINPLTLPINQRPARDVTIRAGRRDFYRTQFARYGTNFDLLPNYPDKFVNPRSQILSAGVEREIVKGMFISADYTHQQVNDIERSIDLNAPAPFDRTTPGQTRTVAAANATRPIVPVNGGFRQINVLMNLGKAEYNGLQTTFIYRGNRRFYTNLSYTLSKATNTTEPDGNGVAVNQGNIARLGEEERGPSLLDQRHRAVLTFTYNFPWRFTAGTVTQLASARPFSATTGVDNNGDGANNDRPVIDGKVIGKSTFRGSPTSDVSIFVENRIRLTERTSLLLRLEGFNLFNHGNYLGRSQTIYGNSTTGVPNADFGALTAAFTTTGNTNALPAFANVDPPRMFQLQARFIF